MSAVNSSSSSSSQAWRFPLDTPQNSEIIQLKEVIQALESKQENTIEVTSKQIYELFRDLYSEENDVFKDLKLRNNFCRFDVAEYKLSKTLKEETKAPKLHIQDMVKSMCSCHEKATNKFATGDWVKMERFINFADTDYSPEDHRLREKVAWYSDLQKLVVANSGSASSAGAAAAGGFAGLCGADATVSGVMKFMTEKGLNKAALTIGKCPDCPIQLASLVGRDLLPIHKTDLEAGIEHLKALCNQKLSALEQASEFDEERQNLSSRIEGVRVVLSRADGTFAEQGEKITRLEAELAICKKQLDQVENDLRYAHPELKEKLNDLETDQRSLTTQRDDLINQIDRLKIDQDDLRQQNRTLEEKSETADRRAETAETENVDIKAENVFLTQMIGTSNATNAVLREGKTFLEGRVTELKEREKRSVTERFSEEHKAAAKLSEANIRVINFERAGIQQSIATEDGKISTRKRWKTLNEGATAGVGLVALGVILAEAAPLLAVGAAVTAVGKFGHFVVKNDRDNAAIAEAERGKIIATEKLRAKSAERRERADSAERHKEASNFSVQRSA